MISTGLGLRCRWPGNCGSRFISDGSVAGIRDCAAMRDEHEREGHGYWHQVVPLVEYSRFASHRGRSTLSLKSKGKLT